MADELQVPRQLSEGNGTATHDAHRFFDEMSRQLADAQSRLAALEVVDEDTGEVEIVPTTRDNLAEGFGRILLGPPSRTDITTITAASDASYRLPTFTPDLVSGTLIFNGTLSAPNGGNLLRVRFKVPGTTNAIQSAGCVVVAWLDDVLYEIYGGNPVVRTTSNFWVSEARGEFWTVPDVNLKLQVYTSSGTFFVNGASASTALYNGELHAYVEVAEWADI